jgi:hypothetical protein
MIWKLFGINFIVIVSYNIFGVIIFVEINVFQINVFRIKITA